MICVVASVNCVVFVIRYVNKPWAGIKRTGSNNHALRSTDNLLILVVSIHTLLLPLAQRLQQKPFSLRRMCCRGSGLFPRTFVSQDIPPWEYPLIKLLKMANYANLGLGLESALGIQLASICNIK